MKKALFSLLLPLLTLCLLPDAAQANTLAASAQTTATAQSFQKESLIGSVKSLSLKEKIGLKRIEKKLQKAFKNEQAQDGQAGKTRNKVIAIVLCFFLGALGIHRFYLGYTGWGIAFLLTAGFLGIGVLVDFIRILIGGLKPKGGSYD